MWQCFALCFRLSRPLNQTFDRILKVPFSVIPEILCISTWLFQLAWLIDI